MNNNHHNHNNGKEVEKLVFDVKNLQKTYGIKPIETKVLQAVDLTVSSGEHVAIVGSSGSGKSTLLHLLGGLDDLNGGQICFLGKDIAAFSQNQLAAWRNESLGFIYQFHHLLSEFTALENVVMPLLIRGERGVNKKVLYSKAQSLLEEVGLSDRVQHRPSELSGGERQRVAIARALVNDPVCVLADEPTGNLDDDNAKNIYQMMLRLSQDKGTAFIMVTHNHLLAKQMDVVYELKYGLIEMK